MDQLIAALPPVTSKSGGNTKFRKSFSLGSQKLPRIVAADQKSFFVDERGNDLTPKPLLNSQSSLSKLDQKASTTMLTSFAASFKNQTTGEDKGDAGMTFGFTSYNSKSSQKHSSVQRSLNTSENGDNSDISSNADDSELQTVQNANHNSAAAANQRRFNGPPLVGYEDSSVEIFIQETKTLCFLDISSICPGTDYSLRETVSERNAKYQQVKKAHLEGDKFTESSAQTLKVASKCRESQTDPKFRVSSYSQCDFGPSTDNSNEGKFAQIKKTAAINKSDTSKSGLLRSISVMTSTASIATEDSQPADKRANTLADQLINPSITKSLYWAEQRVLESISVGKVLTYYDFSDSSSVGSASTPQQTSSTSMTMLWSFRCEEVKGRAITCITWNRVKQDIVAIAYSGNQDDGVGVIVIWSINRPDMPLKVLKISSLTTSMDFSSDFFTLLACGSSDGTVCIFNIGSDDSSQPIWTSFGKFYQHEDLVVSVKWFGGMMTEESADGATSAKYHEKLLSVGKDGVILEWNISKSMECREILTAEDRKSKSKTGFLSRSVDCLSFDIKNDGSILLGTEQGQIEQFQLRLNHSAESVQTLNLLPEPVYRISWSPSGGSALFLGCDSIVKCFEGDLKNEGCEIQCGKSRVNDISWCTDEVFGVVTDDGRIELWDISKSTVTPIIQHSLLDHRLNQIIFAPNNPCALVGDTQGTVTVYKVKL